jgi:hypothetical protein
MRGICLEYSGHKLEMTRKEYFRHILDIYLARVWDMGCHIPGICRNIPDILSSSTSIDSDLVVRNMDSEY